MNKYKTGDIVELSPDSQWAGEGEHNPLHTPGTVLNFSETLGYQVNWYGIGTNDQYYDYDLMPATKLGKLLLGVDT
jgi:hypothetical protein